MLRKKPRPTSYTPSLTPSLQLDLPPPTLEIEWARSAPSLDLSGISRSLSRLRKASAPRGSKPPQSTAAPREDLIVIPETVPEHRIDFSKPAPYSPSSPTDASAAPAPTSPTSLNSWVHVQTTSPNAYQPMSPASPTSPVSSVTPAIGQTPISSYYTNNTSLDFTRMQSFPMPPERAILKLPSVNMSEIQFPENWDVATLRDHRRSEILNDNEPIRTSHLGNTLDFTGQNSAASHTHLDVSSGHSHSFLTPSSRGYSSSDLESIAESNVSTADNYFVTASTGTHRTFGQEPPPHTFERVETSSPYYRPEANASTFSLRGPSLPSATKPSKLSNRGASSGAGNSATSELPSR